MAALTGNHTINAIGPNRNPNTSAAFENFAPSLYPPLIFANDPDVMGTKLKLVSKSKKKKRVYGPARSGHTGHNHSHIGDSYAFNYFYRIRILDPSIDFGTFTDSTSNFIIWNAYFDDRTFTVINTTAVAADNLILTGSAAATMSGLEVLSYSLAAGPDGNPSIDVTYQWDFGVSVVDPVLVVAGQRVILLPWIALESMTKRLSWLTGTIKTYASEQRRGLRRAPRQEISYDIYLPGRDRLDFETRIVNLSALYAVPLWYDIDDVGALSIGQTTVSATTVDSFLQPGGLVYLYQSKNLVEAKTIDTVGVGTVTFTSGIARTYSNAKMVSAVACYFATDPTINRDSAENSFASLSFNAIDYYELPVGSYQQHKGLDVLVDPSVVNDTVQMQITQSRTVRDNNIGPISVGVNESRVRTQDMQRWIKSTRAGRYQLEQWFQSRYGQRKAFYQPTWAKDFVVTTNIGSGATFIDIETTPMPAPFEIMVALTNGTKFFREVLTKEIQGGGHRLNLAVALGQDVDVDEIDRVSLLRLTRHASDGVTIQYDAPNITRAEIPTTTH